MTRRPLYRHADLLPLLAPRTVAIFGVSPNKGALGSMTLANMAGFDGEVYAVNPRYESIDERTCYPGLAALPGPVDCAVVSVPADGVEAVLTECAANGVRAAVVFSAGFAETGREDRVALQARIADIAREANIRLVGPNCIGVVNFTNGLSAMFNQGLSILRPEGPAIGIVSQSGAMGVSLACANQQGMAISHMLAAGNSCDVTVADYVSYLAEDSNCRSIACVFEGLSDPGLFLEAQDVAASAGKPLVVLKLARGEEGAKAALSHTGSLAGSDAAYEALFRKGSAVQVDNWESLLETAAFFAKAPDPTAPGVALAATSGGFCIMGSDAAEREGIAMPPPGPEVSARLTELIPDFAKPSNPCDMTGVGRANAGVITDVLSAFLDHPDYGAAVIPHAMPAAYAIGRVPAFEELAERTGKPLCVVWTAGWLSGPGALEFEQAPHLPLFRSMDRCFTTLKAWQDRAMARSRPEDPGNRLSATDAAEKARAILLSAGGRPLTEDASKALLALYGVPVTEEHLVQTTDEAADKAAALGYPVVLKAVSAELLHKTEAGAVHLNLEDEAAVRMAFDAIVTGTQKAMPGLKLDGVLVQPMVRGNVEIMLGARIDPLFGPLVLVGFGGVLVELLRDSVTMLAPVNRSEAAGALDRLKGARLLDGFRGSKPVDRQALAEIIARFSEFVADHADLIEEVDINPLIGSDRGLVAVDALVIPRATA